MKPSHPLQNPCPTCGALPGEPCQGRRGERKAFHRGRGSRMRRAIIPADYATESPIEAILSSALVEWVKHHGAAAEVLTQVPVGRYRADIIVQTSGKRLLVECDGAAFHTSPDQVEYDKRRDRFFAVMGIPVMRFTGREIQRDPRGCAAQVGVWILAQ